MFRTTQLSWIGVLALPLVIGGCSGGKSGDASNRGRFQVALISTGTGQIYPHRIRVVDENGVPTQNIIEISLPEHLTANVNENNGVLPVAVFATTPTLPNGAPGNQYVLVRFSHKVRPESVLSDLPINQSNSGLTGALQVIAYDPVTEETAMVRGRGFVAGKTYYDDLSTPGLDLKLVQAVEKSGSTTNVRDPRADGFPRGFAGDQDLVEENAFVFVPDDDENMSTLETFPPGKLIRILASSAVQDSGQKPLIMEVCTATTVGPDTIAPQIIGYTSAGGPYAIQPGNGQTDVDPLTQILVKFTKPVQPRDVGEFFSTTDKTPPTRGIGITVTAAATTYPVIYYADPVSVGDFCNYLVTPAYNLPGKSTIKVAVNTTIRALTNQTVGTVINTSFDTGDGPGIVNAPVSPEAIYIGIGGSQPGVAVLDMNGFGQGTGDLLLSNFAKNPNLGQPGLNPQLTPGTTNLDAGGEGPMTLVKDSTGTNFRLLGAPTVREVTDIHIGHPLDKVFNNENINPWTIRANQVNPGMNQNVGGVQHGNSISQPPHPNPPKLVFPPPNPGQSIFGEEPTMTSSGPPYLTGVVMTTHPPAGPCTPAPINKLVKGNPFAQTKNEVGLFDAVFAGIFVGPQLVSRNPQPPIPFCPYTSRQQVGHFLYVLDRGNRQVLVVNSNRFTVLETIKLSDPTSGAVSPNLKVLAVSNFSSATVSFIDIDPNSPNFHRVTTETAVGRGPSGLAWQPEGEDLLVANQVDSSVSIIAGSDFRVRKTVTNLLNRPIDVAVTSRQSGQGFGYQTGIYFAYILNGNGTIAIFESGPDGVNGIGFDNVVGVPGSVSFKNARAIQMDPTSLVSAVWIAHQDETGLGQVSHLELTTSLVGPIPIQPVSGGFILPPTFRQREWTVTGRIGGSSPTTPVKDRLSGQSPADVAFDDVRNFGYLPDIQSNQISNLTYAVHSGKAATKAGLLPGAMPKYIFIPLADSGTLDIFELDTGAKVRTLEIPGIRVVSSYWRQ